MRPYEVAAAVTSRTTESFLKSEPLETLAAILSDKTAGAATAADSATGGNLVQTYRHLQFRDNGNNIAAEASATRGIVQASEPAAEEVQVQVQFVSYIPNPWKAGTKQLRRVQVQLLSSTANPCTAESQQLRRAQVQLLSSRTNRWKPAAEQVQLLRLRKSLGSLKQGDEDVQVELLGFR